MVRLMANLAGVWHQADAKARVGWWGEAPGDLGAAWGQAPPRYWLSPSIWSIWCQH